MCLKRKSGPDVLPARTKLLYQSIINHRNVQRHLVDVSLKDVSLKDVYVAIESRFTASFLKLLEDKQGGTQNL